MSVSPKPGKPPLIAFAVSLFCMIGAVAAQENDSPQGEERRAPLGVDDLPAEVLESLQGLLVTHGDAELSTSGLSSVAPDAGDDPSAGEAQVDAEEPPEREPTVSEKLGFPSLQSIRVRPYADVIRVVLELERPTPYLVNFSRESRRATLQLLEVGVDFFASELNRIGDPRLAGIFLREVTPQGAMLEFRLGADDVDVEDFALSDPSAIVLDFFHTQGERVALSGSAMEVATSAAGLEKMAPPVDGSGAWTQLDRREFEGFPVEEVILVERGAQKVFDLFLDHQWATALTEGLAHLETNPGTEDLAALLILLAEARYRISSERRNDPLTDRINFYDQALRSFQTEPLEAFAHWRLATLKAAGGFNIEALLHVDAALDYDDEYLREPMRMERARSLAANHRIQEAIDLAREIQEQTSDDRPRLEMAVFEGRLLQDSGDFEGAWQAFEKASELEPEWRRFGEDRAMRYAILADELGKQKVARDAYAYAIYQDIDRISETPGLYLRYADLLRRLSEQAREDSDFEKANELDAEADQWYTRVLALVEPRAEDEVLQIAEAKKKLREGHASDITAGSASYAMFHASRGEIEKAMVQLRKAHYQSVLDASSTRPLWPAIVRILEPHLAVAAGEGRWHEIIGDWSMFGEALGPGTGRTLALSHVAKALAALGVDGAALELVDQLIKEDELTDSPLKDEHFVLKAEILGRMGRGGEFIERLEQLRQGGSVTKLPMRALKALARIYESEGRYLEAAQTHEEMASAFDLDPDERGEAWHRAGMLYMEKEGLAIKTREIGLRALWVEEEQTGNANSPRWSPRVSKRLRFMLARAFFELEQYEMAARTFEFYLGLPEVTTAERGMARFLLGEAQRLRGKYAEARLAYEAATSDSELPEIWRLAATEALASLEWEVRSSRR